MRSACMRNKHIQTAAFCLIVAAGSLLGGCSTQQQTVYEPTQTALELHEDGTLTETIIDVLDQSWYSSSELESMIVEAVNAYNIVAVSDAVTADSINLENNQVSVQLSYADGNDYAAFNHVVFYTGSMLNAQMEGYLFDTSFHKVSKGTTSSETLSNEEPLSHKEYQVLIGDTAHEYHVPGKIAYISSNAVTTDAYTVQAVSSADTADGSETANGLIYILFEF